MKNVFFVLIMVCALLFNQPAHPFRLESIPSEYPPEIDEFVDAVHFDGKQYLFFEFSDDKMSLVLIDPEYKYLGFESGFYEGDIEVPSHIEIDGHEYPVTSIDAFQYDHVKSIVIPSTVTDICGSFLCCDLLDNIILSSNISRLSGINSCGNLKHIEIPDGILSVTESLNETGIEKIELPMSTECLKWSFSNNRDLRSVNLGTVSSISDSFNGCPKINEIFTALEVPPVFPGNSFDELDFTSCTLYVPDGCQEAYCLADGWNRFGRIEANPKSGVNASSANDAREFSIVAIDNGIAVRSGKACRVTVTDTSGKVVADRQTDGQVHRDRVTAGHIYGQDRRIDKKDPGKIEPGRQV